MSNISTHLKNRDEFARAFRDGSLCTTFEALVLSGPQGSFPANGILVRKEKQICLEFVPIPPDGTSVPEMNHNGVYSQSDFWQASGRTLDGHDLNLEGILMLGFADWTDTLEPRDRYSRKIERISFESPADGERDGPVRVSVVAWIADSIFRYGNTGAETITSHPYRESRRSEERSDSLMGTINKYQFCVSQDGPDIKVEMHSKAGGVRSTHRKDENTFGGLLTALALLQGQETNPWRTSHERSSGFRSHVLAPRFDLKHGVFRPIHESRAFSSDPTDLLELAGVYFARQNRTAKALSKYVWQLWDSAGGSGVTNFRVLHLCAILEGVTKQLLADKVGWSKTRLKRSTAIARFKAIAKHYSIPWTHQFAHVARAWKNPRNALAHGDLFARVLSAGRTIQTNRIVSAGILSLIMKEIGWEETPDFSLVNHYDSLYPLGF